MVTIVLPKAICNCWPPGVSKADGGHRLDAYRPTQRLTGALNRARTHRGLQLTREVLAHDISVAPVPPKPFSQSLAVWPHRAESRGHIHRAPAASPQMLAHRTAAAVQPPG